MCPSITARVCSEFPTDFNEPAFPAVTVQRGGQRKKCCGLLLLEMRGSGDVQGRGVVPSNSIELYGDVRVAGVESE